MSLETFRFPQGGDIPNSVLPLLVYRSALPAQAAAMWDAFAANGWLNGWTNGIYPFHHFHSIAHEVLGIARGQARVAFGGPDGQVLQVEAGDVVVIPAGVGHRNMGASTDFQVVGAYPGGADWDLRRGDPGERAVVLRNIAAVPRPDRDPVSGGPIAAWQR